MRRGPSSVLGSGGFRGCAALTAPVSHVPCLLFIHRVSTYFQRPECCARFPRTIASRRLQALAGFPSRGARSQPTNPWRGLRLRPRGEAGPAGGGPAGTSSRPNLARRHPTGFLLPPSRHPGRHGVTPHEPLRARPALAQAPRPRLLSHALPSDGLRIPTRAPPHRPPSPALPPPRQGPRPRPRGSRSVGELSPPPHFPVKPHYF